MNANLQLLGFTILLSLATAGCGVEPKPVSSTNRPSPSESKPIEPQPELPKAGELIENSLQMRLVYVPAGEFEMGSPESLSEPRPDELLHRVRLTKGFYLGAYEVTVGQFREFVRDSRYKSAAETDGKGGWGVDTKTGNFEQRPEFNWRNPGFSQGEDHPVVNISWQDSQAFCKWLSEREGKAYRLPTEAEWEYACRAGTKTDFSCGNSPDTLVGAANVADATAKARFPDWPAIAASDGYVFTAPVGKLRPNAFGLFDMHGNVWEWCADWHGPYRDSGVVVVDPKGPVEGEERVLRGGSFTNELPLVRSAARFSYRPVYGYYVFGFRVVKD